MGRLQLVCRKRRQQANDKTRDCARKIPRYVAAAMLQHVQPPVARPASTNGPGVFILVIVVVDTVALRVQPGDAAMAGLLAGQPPAMRRAGLLRLPALLRWRAPEARANSAAQEGIDVGKELDAVEVHDKHAAGDNGYALSRGALRKYCREQH
jgi:hypothetical protein